MPPVFTQPSYPGAKREEIATLEVNVMYFSDWETVWIRWSIDGDPVPQFRFTCAEREPIPDLWTKLQFKPRDDVIITLGGLRVISGRILIRQVAYDGNTHGVSLQGIGFAWYGMRASIVPLPENNYANFKGTLVEIAQKLLKPTGIRVDTVGNIDASPFDDPPAHPSPGETVFSFIDRLARDRNTIIGASNDKAIVLISLHEQPVEADLVEGFNILSAQVLIDDRGARSTFGAGSQKTASDQSNMTAASEHLRWVPGNLDVYSPLWVPVEHPVKSDHELDLRATYERMWNVGEEIQATITVQGWFNPRTWRLWRPGMAVHVRSPMAMLDQKLAVMTCTYTQDRQAGSRTQLECKNPWRAEMFDELNPTPKTSATTAPPPNPPVPEPVFEE